MRRTTTARAVVATATALVLSLSLAACSGDGGSDDSPSADASASANAAVAADKAALAKVTIEGEAGKEPTVTLPSTPFNVTTFVAHLVEDGDGDELKDGQIMSIQMLMLNGTDGSTMGSTYDTDTPQRIKVGQTSIAELDTELEGAHVGARVLVALSSGEDNTQVYAMEVVDAVDGADPASLPTRAEGAAVAPAAGLPAVTLGEDGAPSITPVGGAAPTTLVTQPLITGTGKVVEEGDFVTVKYTGWLWDGTQFDSAWEKGEPFEFQAGAGAVIQGWDTGVQGQPVGSQVLLVVPPDQGYGDQEQGSIPAGSTLVFVVDILDAR
ncbi:FKBP-type peptidyl-prolyl cis-trans isomerase [Cellulomonas algicola]|uniref:peptidylprolyl isomerase n=1 Tax=Cellulomonas algicola TaxID=2071633 RepID=A0A401V4W1_9CELL|nr:FKBP-type peptidyl-prolyl cis-trans isomerase [Cellulomonas algicola]GCD21937.1 peptidylprolyl isomerase [Cellulomonas algicola]